MTTPYRKIYKLRYGQGNSHKSLEITFPYEVIDKEARSRNISVDEFMERFVAIAEYDGFDGVRYTFEENNK